MKLNYVLISEPMGNTEVSNQSLLSLLLLLLVLVLLLLLPGLVRDFFCPLLIHTLTSNFKGS